MNNQKLATSDVAPESVRQHLQSMLPQLILPAGVAVLFVCFGLKDPRVLSVGNLLNILQQSSFLFFFALAQTIVIVARGFDLSLGPTASMVSVGTALIMTSMSASTTPLLVVIVGLFAGVLLGAIVGLFNGSIVAVGRITPFVVTLGSFNIATGVATTMSGGTPVQGMPDLFFHWFSTGTVLGIPAPVSIAVVTGLVVQFILARTVLGRSLYMIGTNARAAEVAGIRTRYVLIVVYVLSSVLTALGAMILTARTGSGEPDIGQSLALQSAAAAVVGGASFSGGSGGVGTALLGTVFIIILSNGMNLLEVSGYVQMIVLGIIVVAGVGLDRIRARRA